jgi:hypothetical protein
VRTGWFLKAGFATGAPQVVEQRQYHQWQVTTCRMHALQIHRQLAHRLIQQLNGFGFLNDMALLQRQRQLLDLLGEQCGAVEFDHLQAAVHLMDEVQTDFHGGRVMRPRDEGIQCLTRVFEGFGYFALDPLQGHVIVTVSHGGSSCPSRDA